MEEQMTKATQEKRTADVKNTNNKKKKKKEKKWVKFRHFVVRATLYWAIAPLAWIKYGVRVQKFKEQQKRPYLILMNHQTAFDQFFVGMAFRGPVYYLASEDLFSNGWVSSLIRYLVEPIPIKKQTTDIKAIINCIRVAMQGGTIAIAPEGNRTYSGRTEYMSPSIAYLAKKIGLPIALYRIEGGYGVQPRWSDVTRRGKLRGYVSRVIYPEEFKEMSDAELFAQIEKELYVNEAVADTTYTHKKLAEYLERAIYVCPKCGLSTFESHGDLFECKKCGLTARYTPTKEFEAVSGEIPFRFVADWYDYQSDYINSIDVTSMTDAPLYCERADLYEVIPYKKKVLLQKDVTLSLYGDRLLAKGAAAEYAFPYESTLAVTVLGRNKLNVYADGKIYQLKSDKRFNALKYVHIYHRYKNIVKGEGSTFLGL
jgi:1-acyl-sn-glycerol-3-phosphate acyltransferase